MKDFRNIYNTYRLKQFLDDICRQNYIGSQSSFKGFEIEFFKDYYENSRWEIFQIAKDRKKSTYRIICAPKKRIKLLLMCIKDLLKEVYVPSSNATAYSKGKGIKVNACIHIRQNWVYNIDLKDFFFHINQKRIEKRLIQPPFNFKNNVANILAYICCMQDKNKLKGKWGAFLPQGSPVSPLLSNAVCDKMDLELQKIARFYGYHYSRYADDITFSGGNNISKNNDFINKLNQVIEQNGFVINKEKTRCQHYTQRQIVTGLVVNEKVNISTKYCKGIRSLLHIWEKYGYDAAVKTYFEYYPTESRYCNLINKIDGKIEYIRHIKGKKDSLYIQLSTRFEKLVKLNASNSCL